MPGFAYTGTITLACSVADMDRAIAWYRQHLGFEVVFSAEGWTEMTTPATGVTIGLGQDGGEPGRGGTMAVFGVADIAAARAELERNGVTFEGETIDMPGLVKLATFVDPDGNHYMLSEAPAGG